MWRDARVALEQLLQRTEPVPGRPRGRLVIDLVGFLPQRLDGLDDASAMENVQAVAPETPVGIIRNQLARLLLRGDSVDCPVRTLSAANDSESPSRGSSWRTRPPNC